MILRKIVQRDPTVPLSKEDFRIVEEVMLDGSSMFSVECRHTVEKLYAINDKYEYVWDRLSEPINLDVFTENVRKVYPSNADIHLSEKYIDLAINNSIVSANYYKSTTVVKTIIHSLQ